MRDLWAFGLLVAVAVGMNPPNRTGVEAVEAKTPEVFYGGETSVAERLLSHSVMIAYTTQSGQTAIGSGVLYKKNGKVYVMTAAHVVADGETYGCGSIVVMFTPADSDKPCYMWIGKLVAHNGKLDAAIIELQGADPAAVNGAKFQNRMPRIGTGVYAVGNPTGDINTVTEGIVCNNKRTVDWCEQHHFQVSCHGGQGLSGGGVFASDTGECLGLVVRLNMHSRILMVVPMSAVIDWMQSNNLSDIAPVYS